AGISVLANWFDGIQMTVPDAKLEPQNTANRVVDAVYHRCIVEDISDEEKSEIAEHLAKIRKHLPAVEIARALARGERQVIESSDTQCRLLLDAQQHPWRERLVTAWSLGVAELRSLATDQAVNALSQVVEGKVRVNDRGRATNDVRIEAMRALYRLRCPWS